MSLRAAVERVHAAFDAERALERVRALAALDRYQVSEGIERAADYVAAEAERAGLEDVSVTSYPGGSTWWTYAAPPAWTPRSARLLVDGDPLATYPETPCSLATFSRPTPPRTVPLVTFGEGSLDGALAVVPPGTTLSGLGESGALGFVACASPVAVGRIELPPDTRLVGFSVDREALARALRGGEAFVHVDVAASGSMPLVTGRLPGETSAEVLFLAHLCHPRPGANDNASGVAATLGLAEALRADGIGLRFVWGPEFVGTAAYLHDVVGTGRAPLPRCVLNLDMVGEDQVRCGGPLVLERSHLPSPLDAVAERAAAIVAERAPSTWAWRSTPFLGASDHLLFADRPFGVPTLQLGHRPDRFNHTSADDVENVDPEELRRAATIAGATVLSAPLPEPRPSGTGARAWEGPFNLRAALADAQEGDRRWFEGELAADRLGVYARAVGLALRIGGDAPVAEDSFEKRFLELLRTAGWLGTTGVWAAAERYLGLAVEASAGPEPIVELVLGDPPSVAEPRSYGELAAEAEALARDLDGATTERGVYVAGHLGALAAACRVASGDRPPLERLVADLLGGVRATRVDEARFDEALAELDALVPGTGELRGRVEAWRRRRALPLDLLPVLARRLLAEARRRTVAAVSLPAVEMVEVAVVRGRPWSASCTYLGGLRSRIELGADEPPTFARLVDLVCHEAYPGHHTERVRQELRRRPECRPVLTVGPSSVVSEGLASHAATLVFDEDDLRVLAREAGLSPEEEVVEWRAAAILSRLRAVNSNAALLPPAERAEYLVRYGLRSPERAERIAAWLADPLHAAYTFAYPAGLTLVEDLVARNGREETLRLLLR